MLAQEKSIASVSNLFHLIFSEIVYSLSSEFHSLGVSDRVLNNIFTKHHGNFELTSVSCSLQLKHRKLLPFINQKRKTHRNRPLEAYSSIRDRFTFGHLPIIEKVW